jgi:hypothetical protein
MFCGIDDGIGPRMADKDSLEDGRRKKSFAVVRFHRGTLATHHGEIPHRLFTKNTLPFVDSQVNHPFTVVTLVSPKPFH